MDQFWAWAGAHEILVFFLALAAISGVSLVLKSFFKIFHRRPWPAVTIVVNGDEGLEEHVQNPSPALQEAVAQHLTTLERRPDAWERIGQ